MKFTICHKYSVDSRNAQSVMTLSFLCVLSSMRLHKCSQSNGLLPPICNLWSGELCNVQYGIDFGQVNLRPLAGFQYDTP